MQTKQVDKQARIKVGLAIATLIGSATLLWNYQNSSSQAIVIKPIFRSVASNDVEAVRLAAASPSSRNALDPDGNTPLHKSVITHIKPNVLKTLLDAGAVTEIKNRQGYTPLGYAVLIRDWDPSESIAALLEAGADAAVKMPTGQPLIHWVIAERQAQEPMVSAFLSKVPRSILETKNATGQTPLDLANETKNTRAAELIKQALSRPNELAGALTPNH